MQWAFLPSQYSFYLGDLFKLEHTCFLQEFLTIRCKKKEDLLCGFEGRCVVTEHTRAHCPGCWYNKAASMGIVAPLVLHVGKLPQAEKTQEEQEQTMPSKKPAQSKGSSGKDL